MTVPVPVPDTEMKCALCGLPCTGDEAVPNRDLLILHFLGASTLDVSCEVKWRNGERPAPTTPNNKEDGK